MRRLFVTAAAATTALLVSALLFSQQTAENGKAPAKAKGSGLIRPLADVKADLKGSLERIQVHGKSLEGNLEGDSADRDVFVYLPPSYGKETGRRYPASDTTLAARYARAIAAYRFGRVNEALGQIDQLISAQPQNPYFHELKGQTLLEAGRPGQAVAPLKRAVALAPAAAPIKVMLGHALVSSGSAQAASEAIPILNRVTQQEQENGDAFQFLAMAYEKKGDQPMAQLSAAQALFLAGRHVEARTQASRAQKQFQQGSSGWLKADDILNYRPPKE